MDAARWERIQDLFHRAAAEPESSRRDFVTREAGADAALAADVLGMLEEDGRGSLLDRELAFVARDILGSKEKPPLPNEHFGPYRAVKFLGEGGMGVVFLARREDLRSEAALKVLRDGSLSPARRERFAAEQRTLAQLNHPSIARLYDAGTSASGTPWIAMEYVDGLPLTEYCEQSGAGLAERLRLFREVCAAVQHAHRYAIIHRDLKPSNILVRADGSIKLLDFGIAKQLDADGPADRTRTVWRLATPAYAAPEQLRGEAPGTYTDVYALGVVLYQLLAGKLPFDLATGTPGEAERLIVEGEAVPPSAVAREGGPKRNAASGDAAAGAVRGVGRSEWADLDVLCLTAMHREPQRRYSTVDALMRDVDRFLAGEPLEARPESAAYRVGKFVRKHRRPLSVAAAVLVATVALVTHYTVRLTAARNEALAEAARTHRIQSYMLSLFAGGDEEAGPPDSLRVVTLVDRGLQEARALDNEPLVQAELYHTLGGIYQQLGRTDRADSLLTTALERRRALLGEEHAEVAESLVALSLLRVDQAQYEDAERFAREGLELSRRVLPAADPLVGQAMVAVGRVLEERGEYDAALAMLEGAVRHHQAMGAPEVELAASLHELANTHFYAGNYTASDSLNRQVLALSRRVHGGRHPDVADDLVNLGATQVQMGRYEDAERFFREALQITESWYGAEHVRTATNLTMLGRALVFQNRFDEAEATLRRALAVLERVRGPSHPRVASIRNELGSIALQTEHWDEAEAEYGCALEIYRAAHGEEHDLVALMLANLASVQMKRGDYARAEAGFRDVVGRYTRALSADHINTGIARIKLGRTLLRQGKFAEAAVESRAGHDILAPQSDPSISFLVAAREDLVAAYTALGRMDEAEQFRATPAAAPAVAAVQ